MSGETAKEAQQAPPIQSTTESPCVPPRATSPPTTSSSSAPILYSDLNEYDFVHYASIYFQRKKPRLFHPFSLEELISYTTEVPLRPLHFIHQLFTSTVLEVERDIMIFMDITVGYVTSESPSTVNKKLLENIVYQSYCNQSIFDEVVCFTIKEINNNPQETSCYLGFKLLYILLMMRRPSLPLLKYVLSFVYRQIVDSNVGGFAREIMKEYLENTSPAIGDFHMSWFAKICDLADQGFKPFPQSLAQLSVKEIIETENFAGTLLSHGIMPPKNFSYAWYPLSCKLCVATPLVGTSICRDPYVHQMLHSFLQGVILYIRISHDREYKERLVTLDESLLLIRWMSLHSTKPKLREFHVKDFEVRASAWMLIPRA